MARLAGIYDKRSGRPTASGLRTMLAALCANGDWDIHSAAGGRAAVGWVGSGRAELIHEHGVIVAMDGQIYDRQGFDVSCRDAEIVAALYAREGFERLLSGLNGDFAIALYDIAADVLWLARDRFGVKPLYYVDHADRCAFSSRAAALLTLPEVDGSINRGFAARFAGGHYRYIDNVAEESPYRGVSQLPGGHLLRVTGAGGRSSRYWSLEEGPDVDESPADLAEQYRDLLKDAVRLRVARAAAPAFTLSGGMDSSSVVSSAAHTGATDLHAFSTVYEDATYDESADIKPMIDTVDLSWHPVLIGTPDVFSLIERLVRLHDEPVATATWLSHFLLCQEVRRLGFGSLFGGLGGDELNAGEYEYFLYFFADLKVSGDQDRLEREIGAWIEHHDHPVFRKSPAVVEEGFATSVDFSVRGRCRPDRRRLRRYFAAVNPEFFDLEAFEPRMDHLFTSYLKNRTMQDLVTETLPCCLRAQDRHGAALGLEHYSPFLDHRLVEFMFRVPGRLKIRQGRTKELLRQAMAGILPEETRTRIKKTGWNAPAHVWFSGRTLADLRDLVSSRVFRERGLYDIGKVAALVDEHVDIVRSGRAADNHMMFLWQLVNTEMWLRSHDERRARASTDVGASAS